MTVEGDKNYCHIRGDKGLLCGTTGDDIVYYDTSNEAIEEMEKRGDKRCGSCHRPRCQECLRLWRQLQVKEKVGEVPVYPR